MAIRLSAMLGACAAVGSCSNQLARPRPVFGASTVVLMAFGVVVAGPRNISWVNISS